MKKIFALVVLCSLAVAFTAARPAKLRAPVVYVYICNGGVTYYHLCQTGELNH